MFGTLRTAHNHSVPVRWFFFEAGFIQFKEGTVKVHLEKHLPWIRSPRYPLSGTVFRPRPGLSASAPRLSQCHTL